MVADLVREVGGERVNVKQLMGAGVDPHLYKATRDDIQLLSRADIVFYSGLLLEGKLDATLRKLGAKMPVCAVADRIQGLKTLASEDNHEHPDPHVWMDVALWSKGLPVIADALSKLNPEWSSEFEARSRSLNARLVALHEYGRAVIGSIPKERRVLITSHDAFRYLGQAYDLEVIGIQGISTASEAGLQQINRLVDLLVERKLNAVFVETSVPQKSIQALVDGARARGHEVKIGGELFSDAMGEEGTYEGTYIGMLDHNLTTIARGLGGQVPDGGFRGR